MLRPVTVYSELRAAMWGQITIVISREFSGVTKTGSSDLYPLSVSATRYLEPNSGYSGSGPLQQDRQFGDVEFNAPRLEQLCSRTLPRLTR
jgi:hypothetical protein